PPEGDLAADIANPRPLVITDETRAKYPHLTDAQIAALDRMPDDGRISPGGAPAGGNRRARRARDAGAAE
ncbi:MAG: hypothetical protein KIS90_11355, partial [Phenylobacterium sp.]|nr:hypothetical protein [Phenylobacterium sp.]